jgi:hypothetical protein
MDLGGLVLGSKEVALLDVLYQMAEGIVHLTMDHSLQLMTHVLH